MAYITDSWEQINEKCALGKHLESYAIGDLKTITVTHPNGSTESIDLEIVDFDVDNLGDGSGKACITFISKKVLWNTWSRVQMCSTPSINTGGWAGDYSLRSWCNGDLLNALPSDLRSVIQPVKKLSDGGYGSTELVETIDSVWLPSTTEVANEKHLINVLHGHGSRYVATYDGTFKIKNNSNNVACGWWLRSALTDNDKWYIVNGAGSFYPYDGANTDVCVAFGLCVGVRNDNAETKCDMYYYNGVLLPTIPTDVLAQNPYCCIRHNVWTNDTGVVETVGYDLFIGTAKFYLDADGKINSGAEFLWYQVIGADIETATEWTPNGSLNRAVGVSGGVKWANHDMPNGSATATEIYHYGSNMLPKYSSLGKYDDYYKVKGSTLSNISKQLKRISGKKGMLTPEEMLCLLTTIPNQTS